MTRYEAIADIGSNKCAYWDERQCREVAALLREPGLTESDMSTIELAADMLQPSRSPLFSNAERRDVADALSAILARHAPAPKVEWLDCGCNSVAECGEWSLSVWPVLPSQFAYMIHRGDVADDRAILDGRDAAKAAAETKLRELLRT